MSNTLIGSHVQFTINGTHKKIPFQCNSILAVGFELLKDYSGVTVTINSLIDADTKDFIVKIMESEDLELYIMINQQPFYCAKVTLEKASISGHGEESLCNVLVFNGD